MVLVLSRKQAFVHLLLPQKRLFSFSRGARYLSDGVAGWFDGRHQHPEWDSGGDGAVGFM